MKSGSPFATAVPLTEIDPGALAAIIPALRAAQRALAARSREEIVAALSDVVAAWLATDSPWRTRAERLLPAATGFSAAMIRHALPAMIEPLRAPALVEWLGERSSCARAPELTLHVLPSNLPGLAAIPTALSLASGSAALIKAGRGDRVFPALFAASIAEHDAALGAAVAACYWPGGRRQCEEIALAGADAVIAAGSDDAVSDLAARSGPRFAGYGHRVSFAVVAKDTVAVAAAASALAEDIAVWDQRGCLSPRICFVEGDFDAARAFGARVASALRPLADRLPPAAPSAAERLAVRRFREDAEWSALAGERAALFALDGEADGTVVVEAAASFRPTPLCRSLRVMPIAGLSALPNLLRPVRSLLECAGLAAPRDRRPALATMLATCGARRVCALGEMQRPGLEWVGRFAVDVLRNGEMAGAASA